MANPKRVSTEVEQCVHYWIIDNKDVGRCRNCGAVKNFRALLREQKEELHEERVQRSVEHSTKRRGRKAKGIQPR